MRVGHSRRHGLLSEMRMIDSQRRRTLSDLYGPRMIHCAYVSVP